MACVTSTVPTDKSPGNDPADTEVAVDSESPTEPVDPADSDPPADAVDSDPADPVDSETSDSDADVDTDPPAPTGPCDQLLPLPRTGSWLSFTPACEDFTFDAMGNHVAIEGSSGLLAFTQKQANTTTRQGPSIPGAARGTRYLPNGDLLIADPDSGTVWHVVPGGGRQALSAIADPNGIVVDQQGRAYISSGTGDVYRVDAAAGTTEFIADVGASSDGIALSPDEDVLYVNTEWGNVKRMTLGPGDQVGPVQQHASIPIGFSLLDGMTTDVCGNLYVVVMSGRVYRVTPDGVVELAIDVPGLPFITPALNFGSGVGGWSSTSLYVALFVGGVYEVEMGVQGRVDPHLLLP
jgi:outer membrane protein assembly factor BamB